MPSVPRPTRPSLPSGEGGGLRPGGGGNSGIVGPTPGGGLRPGQGGDCDRSPGGGIGGGGDRPSILPSRPDRPTIGGITRPGAGGGGRPSTLPSLPGRPGQGGRRDWPGPAWGASRNRHSSEGRTGRAGDRSGPALVPTGPTVPASAGQSAGLGWRRQSAGMAWLPSWWWKLGSSGDRQRQHDHRRREYEPHQQHHEQQQFLERQQQLSPRLESARGGTSRTDGPWNNPGWGWGRRRLVARQLA